MCIGAYTNISVHAHNYNANMPVLSRDYFSHRHSLSLAHKAELRRMEMLSLIATV